MTISGRDYTNFKNVNSKGVFRAESGAYGMVIAPASLSSDVTVTIPASTATLLNTNDLAGDIIAGTLQISNARVPNVVANATAQGTVALTNLATNHVIIAQLADSAATGSVILANAWCAAANVLTFRLSNVTGAAVDAGTVVIGYIAYKV